MTTTDHTAPPLPDLPSGVEHLLAVLAEHAPSDADRADLRAEVAALLERRREVEMELMLAGMLVDGLRFGNWPWS